MSLKTKLTIALVLFIAACSAYLINEGYLTLETVQENLSVMQDQYKASPVSFLALFMVGYALFVALYIPGPFILNLLAGALLGPLSARQRPACPPPSARWPLFLSRVISCTTLCAAASPAR